MCDGVEPGGLCTGKELPTFQPHPGHSAGAACGGSKNQSVAASARRQDWVLLEEKLTDENGRVKDFLEEGTTDHKGIYRLTYHVAPYFERLQQDSFYPFIEVVFEIKDGKHYHVPITLSPYGYSTYRGN